MTFSSISCLLCLFIVACVIITLRHKLNFSNNTFKRFVASPTTPVQEDVEEEQSNVEFSTSGGKSILLYTIDELGGKCHINHHPTTGDAMTSRYGSDCTDRSQRFPSIEERLKIYLSSWYLPPCSREDPSAVRFTDSYRNVTKTHRGKDINATFIDFFNMEAPDQLWSVSNVVVSDQLFVLDQHNVMEIIETNSSYMRHYVNDVVDSIYPTMTRIGWNYHIKTHPSILLQFGDASFSTNDQRHNVNIPRIQKFRHTIAPSDLDNVISGTTRSIKNLPKCTKRARTIPNTTKTPLTLPAIIWKLNSERHYGHILEVDSIDTVPYRERKNIALFRGGMTGKTHWDPKAKDEDNCHLLQRCDIVMQYFHSPVVDAKVTEPFFPQHPEKLGVHSSKYKQHWATNKMNETMLDYRSEERMTLEDMLKYKMIIILEGNDVSSGLKWALYSHSVVIMTYPTLETSWAMEELLEPYVHFVPIKHDLSDLDTAIQWVLDNEDEAITIALRGRLWIHDLVFDVNIKQEDEFIQDELLKRYRDVFYKA